MIMIKIGHPLAASAEAPPALAVTGRHQVIIIIIIL